MRTIYLDAGVLTIAGGLDAGDTLAVREDATRMVSHLLECGHKVVVVGEDPALSAARDALPPDLRGVVIAEGTVSDVAGDAAGWFVSDVAEHCTGAREHRRLKTVLVGASESTHDLAHRPADRLARSLGDAVLDILASEAMPEPASGQAPPSAEATQPIS
jgi:hypothetical protein